MAGIKILNYDYTKKESQDCQILSEYGRLTNIHGLFTNDDFKAIIIKDHVDIDINSEEFQALWGSNK